MASTIHIIYRVVRALVTAYGAWHLRRQLAARKPAPFAPCVTCDRQHVCTSVGECWAKVHAQDTPVTVTGSKT